jgi:hypothetical protein
MSVSGPFTVQDFIDDAAELLGIVSPAGMTNPDNARTCLRTLNLMLSFWSADEVSARAYVTESFPIVGNQRVYTWGTSGITDFASQRPDKVVTAGLQYTSYGNLIIPMKIIGSDHYQAFGDRLIVTGPPSNAFVDYLMPNASVSLYPIPDQGYNIIFTSIKDLASMTSLIQQFTIDSIYYLAIVYNLAVFMAPKFGKMDKVGNANDPKSIAGIAAKSYSVLIRNTSPDMFAATDYPQTRTGTNAPVLDGGYN